MKIGMIWAQSRNGVIGHQGQLPWHLPEDLAHFKRITQGHPVIMGRKTWDSLPQRFRPLPGRTNIVISRMSSDQALPLQAQGVVVCRSLEEAIAHCQQHVPVPQEVWVIGGAQIYAQAAPLADVAEITRVELDTTGDAIAPQLDKPWHTVHTTSQVTASGVVLVFERLERDTTSS